MRPRNDTQARLSNDTHARLTAFLARCKAKAKGNPASVLPAFSAAKPGLSDAVDQLLFWYDSEQARKASYNANRRQQREAADRAAVDHAKQAMVNEGCPNGG